MLPTENKQTRSRHPPLRRYMGGGTFFSNKCPRFRCEFLAHRKACFGPFWAPLRQTTPLRPRGSGRSAGGGSPLSPEFLQKPHIMGHHPLLCTFRGSSALRRQGRPGRWLRSHKTCFGEFLTGSNTAQHWGHTVNKMVPATWESQSGEEGGKVLEHLEMSEQAVWRPLLCAQGEAVGRLFALGSVLKPACWRRKGRGILRR